MRTGRLTLYLRSCRMLAAAFAAALLFSLPDSHASELDDYAKAVGEFKSILSQRRAQLSSGQNLPNLPGQAVYLARNKMISTYKDLTDALPSKIGRPNKFGIPPA